MKRVRAAWWAAVVSADALVTVVVVVVLTTLPMLIKQRRRGPPLAGSIKSPLLDRSFTRDKEQIVPTATLVSICVCLPLGVQFVLSFFDGAGVKARLYGLAYAWAATVCVVDALKHYVGYWRPYFYHECDFNDDTSECGSTPDGAYQSFPSGHAATAAVALGHTTLCLLGALRCGTPHRFYNVDLGNLKLVVGLAPTALAVWIAASRVVESDHHPADIIAGFCIGSTFAALWYFRYFPGIFHQDSHEPKTPFLDDARGSGVFGAVTDAMQPLAPDDVHEVNI